MQAENLRRLICSLVMSAEKTRPKYGAYLAQLRREAGLSQVELARRLGVAQSNVAFWERSDKPPRSDLLRPMAEALNVRIENLLNVKPVAVTRPPVRAKLAKAFEKASKLSRRQQEKIAEVVEALTGQRNAKP
jgi:transcriptional regulator with XRE-family HTH domain